MIRMFREFQFPNDNRLNIERKVTLKKSDASSFAPHFAELLKNRISTAHGIEIVESGAVSIELNIPSFYCCFGDSTFKQTIILVMEYDDDELLDLLD